MPDWLAEEFEHAAREWAALPAWARPVYVPAEGAVPEVAEDA